MSVALTLLVGTPLYAEPAQDPWFPGVDFGATSSSSWVLLGVVGLTVSTAICIGVGACDDAGLARYFRQNEPGVREALALGAGAELDDLAMLLGVPDSDRGAFGRFMRANRDAILELAYVDDDIRTIRSLVRFAL